MKRAVLVALASLAGIAFATTGAMAQSGGGATERATTVKGSKSNTSERKGGGGGGGTARASSVKSSKSNTSERKGGGGSAPAKAINLNSSKSN